MSTLPWGTMNDWQLLEVEERTTRYQRRLEARAHRAAQQALANPVVRVARPITIAAPAISQADCTAAA